MDDAIPVYYGGCRAREAIRASFAPRWGASLSILTIDSDHPVGRHPGADVCFPTGVGGGWEFQGTRTYDNPDGFDLSWSYLNDDGTLLSVYAYPHHGSHPDWPPEQWAAAEARSIAGVVAATQWQAAMTLPPGVFPSPAVFLGGIQQQPLASLIPTEMNAEAAAKLGLPSLDGVTRAMGVLVLVWSFDDWFVEVRATWLDAGRPAVDVIQETILWSGMPCGTYRDQGVPMVTVDAEGHLPAR